MPQEWELKEILSHRWREEFSEYEFYVSWIDEDRKWEPSYIKLHNFVDKLNTYLLENQLNPWEPPAEYGPVEAPEFIDGKRVRVPYGNDELGKQAARKAILEKTGGLPIKKIRTHRFSKETQDVCYSVITNPSTKAEVWIDSYLMEAVHEELLFGYIEEQLGKMEPLGIGNREEKKEENEESKDAEKEAQSDTEVNYGGLMGSAKKKSRSSAIESGHGENSKETESSASDGFELIVLPGDRSKKEAPNRRSSAVGSGHGENRKPDKKRSPEQSKKKPLNRRSSAVGSGHGENRKPDKKRSPEQSKKKPLNRRSSAVGSGHGKDRKEAEAVSSDEEVFIIGSPDNSKKKPPTRRSSAVGSGHGKGNK